MNAARAAFLLTALLSTNVHDAVGTLTLSNAPVRFGESFDKLGLCRPRRQHRRRHWRQLRPRNRRHHRPRARQNVSRNDDHLSVSGAQLRDVRRKQLAAAEAIRPDVVSVGRSQRRHTPAPVGSMRRDLHQSCKSQSVTPRSGSSSTGSPDMGAPPRIPRLLRGLASHRTRRANRMFEREAPAAP